MNTYSRALRHISMKDVKQKHQQKLIEQKIQEERKKEEEEYIACLMKEKKFDWRSTLTEDEWYAISGTGPTNSVSQTFAYGAPDSGIETTVSGIGGQDAYLSTVTIDGETYDAPTYNQLALAGYAPLIQMQRRIDQQDVNSMLDASQEFAQAVGADYMMNARTEYDPVQALKDDIPSLINMWNRIDSGLTSDPRTFTGLGPESESTIQTMIGFEKYDQIKSKYELSPSIDQGITSYIAMVNEFKSAFWNSVYEKTGVKVDFGISSPSNKIIPPIKYVDTIWGDTYERDSVGSAEVGSKAVGKGEGYFGVLDQLANTFKVGTAKNIFDYHINWQKNPTSKPQDVTALLSPSDKKALQNLVSRYANDRIGPEYGINSDLQRIINANPGLRNSLGNMDWDRGDGAKVVGNTVVITKAYDFDGLTDIGGAGPLTGVPAGIYAASKMGIGRAFTGTDTMNMVVKIPLGTSRKKTQKESTTWERIKKHLKGA